MATPEPALKLVKPRPAIQPKRKRQQQFKRGTRFLMVGPTRLLTRARYMDTFRVGKKRMLVFQLDGRGI